MKDTERPDTRQSKSVRPRRERAGLLVLAVATALVFYVCYRLALPFVPAITWAVALAIVTGPLHRLLAARVRRPTLAAALSVGLVAALIIAPGAWLARQLVSQASKWMQTFKGQTADEQWRATVEGNPQLARALSWFEPYVDVRAEAEQAANSVGSLLSSFLAGSVWTAAQLVITLFTLFYLFRDGPSLLGSVRSLLPLSRREADELLARLGDTVYATVYGSFAVALAQGVLGGLMFWWLGLPAPLFWGLVMTVLSLIPLLGAPVVWVPAALYLALMGGWVKALVLAGWGVVVIGTIDNLLFPVLVGDRLRLHTLLVFFSVVGGLMLFGASGLVLGPAAVVAAGALLEVWRRRTASGRADADAADS